MGVNGSSGGREKKKVVPLFLFKKVLNRIQAFESQANQRGGGQDDSTIL